MCAEKSDCDIKNGKNLCLSLIYISVTILATIFGFWLKTDLAELNSSIEKIRSELNNTGNAKDQDLLIFNRVPKVGSQTILNLLNLLAKRNNFTAFKDDDNHIRNVGETTMLYSDYELSMFMQLFADLTYPASYTKHISFLDFDAFDKLKSKPELSRLVEKKSHRFRAPIYVNMVREPVNRIISWYYYVRAPWYIVKTSDVNGSEIVLGRNVSLNDVPFFKRSYEECVLSRNEECRYIPGNNFMEMDEGGSHVSQIMFFCGHKVFCTTVNGEEAFKQAIYNVEKHYAVVGVMEEFYLSMQVMEKFVPKFFQGAPEVYTNMKRRLGAVNRNIYQPKVDEKIKELVRKNMTREVDFYNFCRQRLYRQYLLIKDDLSE